MSRWKRPEGERVFVEEGEPARRGHRFDAPQFEAEEDTGLDPRVGLPAALPVPLRCADAAGVECCFEFLEGFEGSLLLARRDLPRVALDGST
jgi:hypothetical protein